MLHWGLLPGTLLVLAAIGAVVLVFSPLYRRWWTVVAPAIFLGAVAAAVLIYLLVAHLGGHHPLPKRAAAWIAVMLMAVAAGVVIVIRAGRRRRVVTIAAALVVCAAGFTQIGGIHRRAPVPEQASPAPVQEISLPPLQPSQERGPLGRPSTPPVPASATSGTTAPGATESATPGTTAPGTTKSTAPGTTASTDSGPLRSWRPDGPLPDAAISEVQIPGTVSHFHARIAWVYLPPAYRVSNRPDLPVLILLPGQPGGTHNWLSVGHLATTMDAYAARHHGLAPIVVMPDATGSHQGNTMCVDSRLGNAGTYLSTDVVAWVMSHLQVDPDTGHWAVGGYSFGGTCSLQLAVTHPQTFPTFLDISGEVAPTLGSPSLSVSKAFGGDAAAYRAIQPLRMLAADQGNPAAAALVRTLDGTFVVGAQDRKYSAEQRTVTDACRKAGMAVHASAIPGTHTWDVATTALAMALPHLAARMDLP